MRKATYILFFLISCILSSVITIVISWEQSAKSLSTEKLANVLIIHAKIKDLNPSPEIGLALQQEISCGVVHYWTVHKTLKFYTTISEHDQALLDKAESLTDTPCSWSALKSSEIKLSYNY